MFLRKSGNLFFAVFWILALSLPVKADIQRGTSTRSVLSFKVDPNFTREQLPKHVRVWYDRLWVGIRNPDQWLNSTDMAKSNDVYQYGRGLNAYITILLHVLKVTGDPALLAEVDRVAQLMRAELEDRSILTRGGVKFESDRYLNWQWHFTSDPAYVGTDIHEMDEILAHSLVAAFTFAFYVNRDKDLRYQERVHFWMDYLKNHFEAKWRNRKNITTGKFLEKDLTHAYTQWIRYHYYMHLLTGEQWYMNEARRRAAIVDAQMVENRGGTAFVWDHRTTEERGRESLGCQPFYYGRSTLQAAVDLALEGFSIFNDGFMEKMAGTVRDNILDNGSVDFAQDVCGGKVVGGLEASSNHREDQGRYAISAFVEAGRWDDTGLIVKRSVEVYEGIEEDRNTPRRIFIPAGIVFSLLK